MGPFDRHPADDYDPELVERLKARLLAYKAEEDRGFETPCWVWRRMRGGDGYGRLVVCFQGTEKLQRAHRLAYRFFVGPIPDGKELHHRCEVRECINPEHLQPVTRREHCQLGGPGARTHCIHGHEFTPENTYIRKNGSRYCRRCAVIRQSVRYFARKAAA